MIDATTVSTFRANLMACARAVKPFNAFVEQPVVAAVFVDSVGVRWWRAKGRDLVRTASGDWIGFPSGSYAHPPFAAIAYKASPEGTVEQVMALKGFVVPSDLTQISRPFELTLCAFRRTL